AGRRDRAARRRQDAGRKRKPHTPANRAVRTFRARPATGSRSRRHGRCHRACGGAGRARGAPAGRRSRRGGRSLCPGTAGRFWRPGGAGFGTRSSSTGVSGRAAAAGFSEIPLLQGTLIMMKGQLAGLMRQAQQMQENMKKVQDSLAEILVDGESGGGLVKVSMSCRHDVKRVSIDPSLLADDKDMLEDLVAAAFNDALRKAESTAQEKMAGVTAGMPLPPGMKLPF